MWNIFKDGEKVSLGRILAVVTFLVIMVFVLWGAIKEGKTIEAPAILHTVFLSLLVYIGNSKVQLRIEKKDQKTTFGKDEDEQQRLN